MRKFKLFVVAYILFASTTLYAQSNSLARDTSFTIHSAFIKEKKKYPFIEIAAPTIPANVSAKKDIVYASVAQRNLHIDIYYPFTKQKKKSAGVLLIHGGGWKSGDKSQNEALAIVLASKGYVAVTAEYRLSAEAQYPAGVHDLKDAVKWMRSNAREYNLNKRQVAVLGTSAGGQLAALLGTTNRSKYFERNGKSTKASKVQAIIDIDGVLAFKHPESSEGKVAAEWLGGTPDEKPRVWQEASALTHAGKNTPPILFINSSNPRFHAGQNDFIKKLQPYNIYSEVHTIPDTPHTFWLIHPWFQQTADIIITFLAKIFK
jgi:pectinesterase